VAAALYFIHFGLGLNFLQFLVWSILVVVPFIVQPPATFSWSVFTTTPPLSLAQGYGLGTTFLLYGTLSC